MPKADVVDLSSSDTEALLDSLVVSLARASPVSRPYMGSNCDSFEDWPEVNDMATSVYTTLSADASSSRVPMIDALRDGRRSCVGDSSVRELRSQLTSMKKTLQ
jgi:hypothetical protein